MIEPRSRPSLLTLTFYLKSGYCHLECLLKSKASESNCFRAPSICLILRTLQLGPMHGHAIAKAIEFRSDDVLQVEQGSLYPALHRLIKRRWISFGGGNLGKQSPREVLPTDCQRPAAAGS